MSLPKDLDPSASALAFFGSELRRLRKAAGWTQDQLAAEICYTPSLIGMIETAIRNPTHDFAERCDATLKTDGYFARLWPLVNRTTFPSWFREYAELEESATAIRSFEPQVVDGLLQTEAYARAVLTAGYLDDVDEALAERLERQKILRRTPPPRLWVVLDENVLRRTIGNPEITRAQMEALVATTKNPRIILQILPYDAGDHAGLEGSLTLLSFSEGSDVAYMQGYGNGRLLGTREDVELCTLRYDLLRADALSPRASVELLTALLEEPNTWTRKRYRS